MARAPLTPRDQILAATAKVLARKGLVATTTRAIAHEAGCADGAIFYHFKSRLNLFVALLLERAGDMSQALETLPLRVGERTVAENLCEALADLHDFHTRSVPMLASLFGEPKLLSLYREQLKLKQRGPHLSIGRLAAYLRAEQRLGRIAVDRDPEVMAATLASVSFQEAFRKLFFDIKGERDWIAVFVRDLVGHV